MALEQAELIRVHNQLGTLFNPSGPVSERELFAGRIEQIGRVIEAIAQVGQHVVLYGERGVGKTSLAGLIHDFWDDIRRESLYVVRYNCDSDDTFETVWSNVAELIVDEFGRRSDPIPQADGFQEACGQILHAEGTPHAVRRFLSLSGKKTIIVLDEFDSIQSDRTRLFADAIKSLADYLIETTLVIVGVADDIDQLIADHASVDRSLVQILMPPMKPSELRNLVAIRLDRVGMTIDEDSLRFISWLSQGLPNYAHLMGLHSGREAALNGRLEVLRSDVDSALAKAMQQVEESVRFAYATAVSSPRPANLFRQVLLACALAPCDELGYFAARDIRQPLRQITGRSYGIPQFSKHLAKFIGESRGRVLEVKGPARRRRYRFRNALVKPYTVVRGLQEGLLTEEDLREHANEDDESGTWHDQRML